ncbi:MAG: hypothetical protein E7599_01850 [Ruminococcaceae bacterium]|nr:hypothetical protein [Oscillospiraceae bacterium]
MKNKIKKKRSAALIPTLLSLGLGAVGILAYTILCYRVWPKAVGVGYMIFVLYCCTALLGFVVYRFVKGARENADASQFAFDGGLSLVTLSRAVMPILICDAQENIRWMNAAFLEVIDGKDLRGESIRSVLPRKLPMLVDEKEGVECILEDRVFNVRAFTTVSDDRTVYVTVWHELTDLRALEDKMAREETLVAYITIDNLEELMQFVQGNYRSVASQVHTILEDWCNSVGGVLNEYSRDKYMFFYQAQNFDLFAEKKYDVLDRVREIRVGENNTPVTISIGTARVSGSLAAKASAASGALEMALQRGGDQAVAKEENSIKFYGGVAKSFQKRTKVRARVIASGLASLVEQSSSVLIMGHRFADFDAFGSCVGLARFCLYHGAKNVNIVSDLRDASLAKCFEKAGRLPGFSEMFIDSFTAQDRLRSDTLLIIADVNNKTQFESAELAENACTVVYIDHHRQAAEFETKPAIKYIEPTASSTCELVADMLEQTLPAGALTKDEAELMLAGIVLDTKKFAVNTGTKTFGAAQYLESEGASPIEVQNLFASSQNDFLREAYFLTDLRSIANGTVVIAISHREDNTASDRIAAAKAADKLLSIDGVLASFAVCLVDGAIRISGRSGGKINVQRIMEKLGGGGHFEAAATSMSGVTPEEAADVLEQAVNEYLRETAEAEAKKNQSNVTQKEG